MAEHQLPKLTVRVRFPSSALQNYPWSDALFPSVLAQRRSTAARSGPSTGPTAFGVSRDLRSVSRALRAAAIASSATRLLC
jgi:hypothetical protein